MLLSAVIGNLKLDKATCCQFSKGFDKYDAKITDKTKLTSNGVEGNMIYDFLAVPRNQGKYEIPAVEFTYYDVSTNSYKTIKTQSFNLMLLKVTAAQDFLRITVTSKIRHPSNQGR